jgi:hypothetical protein
MLGCFSLLPELAKVQDLPLAEFGELVVELRNCFQSFLDQVIVHGSDAQSLDSLSDNLIARNFWSLCF